MQSILEYLPELIQALLETSYMVVVAMLVALVLGLPIGTLIYLTNTKVLIIKNNALYSILNGYINTIRAVPFLLLVIFLMPISLMLFDTSLGVWPTPFFLSFISIALFARLVEQTLLEIPIDLINTAYSMRATTKQIVMNFLYVEARSGLILAFTTATISIISYSTVMGVLGGGGIGDFAMYYGYQRYEYTLMNVAIIIMMIIVFLVQLIGSYLAKKLDHK